MPSELPWSEKLNLFSVNPIAASASDVMRMASELAALRSHPTRGETPECDALKNSLWADRVGGGEEMDAWRNKSFDLESRLTHAMREQADPWCYDMSKAPRDGTEFIAAHPQGVVLAFCGDEHHFFQCSDQGLLVGLYAWRPLPTPPPHDKMEGA